MKRFALVLALASLFVLVVGQMAFAGEWNPGHFDAIGGDLPGKYNAASECVFNGLDEPDESYFGAGDGEEMFFPDAGDDILLWGGTPAGGKVQSGGQIVAAGYNDNNSIAGVACNGHLNRINK